MSNIIEFIDSLLPQDLIPISYLELPPDGFGMLIEETGIRGQAYSFNGYDGVISSTIQFYVKTAPYDGRYKEIVALLKRFFKVVQSNKGLEKGNIKLLFVEPYELTTNLRDEKNNYVFSMLFSVIYKEME